MQLLSALLLGFILAWFWRRHSLAPPREPALAPPEEANTETASGLEVPLEFLGSFLLAYAVQEWSDFTKHAVRATVDRIVADSI